MTTEEPDRAPFGADDGVVLSVAFSPDGILVASGSEDGDVRVRDARTGHQVAHLLSDNEAVWSMAFSPDGAVLAVGEEDGSVRTWDWRTGEERVLLTGDIGVVLAVAFDHSGALRAAGAEDGTVRLWHQAASEPAKLADDAGEVVSAAFSPDGSVVAVGWDSGLRLWDVRTGDSPSAFADAGAVQSVAFSPDGSVLAIGGKDESVQFWDLSVGRERDKVSANGVMVESLAFSPDGALLAVGGRNGSVQLLDALTGGTRMVLAGHDGWVSSMGFSPDGTMLVTGGGRDGTVRLWDVRTGEQRSYRGVSGVRGGARDIEQELADATRAVEADPSSVGALVARAEILRDMGGLDEALVDAEQAIAADPLSRGAVLARARILRDMGRFDEALAAVDRMVDGESADAAAYLDRARILQSMERLDEALAEADRAVGLSSDPETEYTAPAEVAAATTPPVVDDDVQFTVYRPQALFGGEWARLLVFAHKTGLVEKPGQAPVDPVEEVQARARAHFGGVPPRPVAADAEYQLAHGAQLRIVPDLPGILCNPPYARVDWWEPVHEVMFRLLAGAELAGTVVHGAVRVWCGPLIVGEVSIAMQVVAGGADMQALPMPEPEPVRRYRKIFPSYSHQDGAIVDLFGEAARALGDQYLQDILALRTGERWDERLRQLIEDADVFQLFWSRNSMRSQYCRDEWEHALALQRPLFVRPLYWEDPLPEDPGEELPPAALRRLHFVKVLGTQPDAIPPLAYPLQKEPRLRLFINYRREDTWGQALLLHQRLAERFGSENVFLDVHSLQPAMSALREIRPQAGSSTVFLALIGSRWLSVMKERAQAAITGSAEDHVQSEIEYALRRDSGFTVIPVLVGDAVPFSGQGLPRSLQPLTNIELERVRPARFGEDLAHLIQRLEAIALARPAAPDMAQMRGPLPVPSAPLASSSRSALRPDDDHYELVLQRMVDEGSLVPFLGPRLTGRQAGSREGSGSPPDADELAGGLATRFGVELVRSDLPAVAQYLYMTVGRPDLYRTMKQILTADCQPGPVHRFLAQLPRRLEELGVEKRYQLIVSTNFDAALEQAFDDEGEPYDLAIHMASGQDEGKFVHFPYRDTPVPIAEPNRYGMFPIGDYGELERTVIVKIHGAVDGDVNGYRWRDNYVVTEDDYIDYLSRSPIENLIPVQVLDKLRNSHGLFLGYTVREWNLRVFLKRIWEGRRIEARSWAVGSRPDALEKKLWAHADVEFYAADPAEYVRCLKERLGRAAGRPRASERRAVTATGTIRDTLVPDSPYVGLTFFTQENAPFFFGRDAERTALISNLRASRLTLLHAQAGAGKSSLLRAGVAARLGGLAQRSLQQRGTAQHIPVVFSSWQDNPTYELIREIRTAVTPFVSGTWQSEFPHDRLDEAIEVASRAADATLLVMLDQFEEYLPNRSVEPTPGRFADELARCVNRADLPANFLIAIRDDAYASLGDLFQGRITNIYGNYLPLGHLDRESARLAIERPIASFNELHRKEPPVEIEQDLVDTVLGQLRPSSFAPGQGGICRPGGAADGDDVAAPCLQVVMKRIWELELSRGSRRLRMQTLEALGGAQTILDSHLDRALGGLADEERDAAADMFRHLVTPSGIKIAESVPELAQQTGHSEDQVGSLLEKLDHQGIVRPIPAAPGRDPMRFRRYEISHDVLGPPLMAWAGITKQTR